MERNPPTPPNSFDATVLFDADCAFCRWSMDKVLAWDRRERIRPLGIQSGEGQAILAPMAERDRLDSWHLLTPGGEVVSAGAAAGPLFRLLPGGRPIAFLFERFPRATDRAYRWVAARRDLLSRWLRIDAAREVRRG